MSTNLTLKALQPLYILALCTLLSASCDKCKDVSCENGGNCDKGVCDCPDGYDLDDCSSQLKPNKIYINKVEFNVKSNDIDRKYDNEFGIDSLPDVGLGILQGTETNYTFLSTEKFDNSNSTEHTFSEGFPYEIDDAYSFVRFSLIDWDGESPREEIYWILFRLYLPDNNFPEVVEFEHEGRTIKAWLKYDHKSF